MFINCIFNTPQTRVKRLSIFDSQKQTDLTKSNLK